jgi:formamidopyrimidine-DNA glycosylase
MPELPDLEVMREALEERILGREILGARAYRPGILKTIDPPLSSLSGAEFAAVSRRAKYLILTCRADLHLVVHLMRTGRIILCRSDAKVTKATGFVLSLVDGQDLRIVETASVKSVRVHLVVRPEDVSAMARSGPEPLSAAFSVEHLIEAFTGVRRQVKKAITDPSVIAGIGTAYADETLFVAKLSPIRYVSTLSSEEIERLHGAIRQVLLDAIVEIRARSGGAALVEHARDFLRVYKRTGQPCPDCGARIAEIRYAEQRTYYCPQCQAGGRTLPDRRSWLTR